MKKSKVKKRFIFLAVVIFGVLFLKFIPEISFGIGKELYEAKRYLNSISYLKIAALLNPKNMEYKYYLALSLSESPMIYEVQRELFALSKDKNAGTAQVLADNKIKNFKYHILKIAGDNYIQQTPYDNKVLRWNASSFPLKVYIDAGNNTPSYYPAETKSAFNAWAGATGGFLKFQFTDNEQSADITFKFIEKGVQNCGEKGCKYVIAHAQPKFSTGQLKRFEIEFISKDNLGQFMAPNHIFLIGMHEIGHALGIMGHSFYPDNLMYPTSVEQDASLADFRPRGISYQDVNTLKLLYSLAPDITNTTMSKDEIAQYIYAPAILGDKEEIGNRKIQQAKNYIQSAPNLPNGYIDLAEAYFGIKKYDEAINALNNALRVSSTDDERYMAYFNMAIVNLGAKNYAAAKEALDKAKSIKSSQETERLEDEINKAVR